MARDVSYQEALEDLEADIGRKVRSGDDEGLTDEALAKRWAEFRKGRDLTYYPSRTLELLHRDERMVRGVMGPVGCLAGDCRIWTERGLERIDTLYDNAEPFKVFSMRKDGSIGLEVATAPFIKGCEPLYKIECQGGASFRGAGSHLVQKASRVWTRIEHLMPGDRLLSNLGTAQQAFPQDVPRLWQRVSDYQERYSKGFHQCDERPPVLIKGALTSSPSQDDVQDASRYDLVCQKSLELVRSDILSGIGAWLRSMLGSLCLSFCALVCRARAYIDQKVCECDSYKGYRIVQKIFQSVRLVDKVRSFVSPDLLGRGEQERLVGFSDSTYITSLGVVGCSVPTDCPEVYYDLTVESTGNYIGEWGIVHHNSGKTTGVIADMNMRHFTQRVCRDGTVRDKFSLVRGTLTMLHATLVETWLFMFPKTNIHSEKYGIVGDLTRVRNGIRHVLEIRGFGLDKRGALNNLLSNNFSGGIINEAVTISEEAKDGVVNRCGRYPDQMDAPVGFEKMDGAWKDKDGYWRWFKNHGVSMDTNAASEDTWWYRKSKDGDVDPELEVYFDQPPAAFKVWNDDLEKWEYELNKGQRPGIPPAENVEHLVEHWDYYRKIIGSSSHANIARYVLCEYSKTEVGTPVFSDFSDRWHVCNAGVPWPAPGTRLFGGMDFGQSRKVVLGYVTSKGQLMIFAETDNPTGSVETFANNVLRPMLANNGFSPSDLTLFCDPAGMNRSEHSALGGVMLMRQCGFDAVPPAKLINNDILTRLEAVRHYLTRIIGTKGAVQIDPSCVQLIRSIGGGYVWGRRKVGVEYMDTDEPYKNHHSHIADAFQYLCCGVRWGGDIGKVISVGGSQYKMSGNLYLPAWETAGAPEDEFLC